MGAGVGIRTGPQPDGTWLLAADADTLDERCARIIEAQVEGTIGATPIRIGNAPKALYLIRVAAPPEGETIPYMSLGFNGGVLEILGRGKQFVAGDSIHPVTLKPYFWKQPIVRFEDPPIRSIDQIHALMSACAAALPEAGDVYRGGAADGPENQEALVGDPAILERAVPLVPNVYEFVDPGPLDVARAGDVEHLLARTGDVALDRAGASHWAGLASRPGIGSSRPPGAAHPMSRLRIDGIVDGTLQLNHSRARFSGTGRACSSRARADLTVD